MAISYYTPTDNSWATCIETGKKVYPAGFFYENLPAITLKVTRQPFYKCVYLSVTNKRYIVKMIEGVDESTGLHYRAIYKEV